jgi:hypothetical protein
LVDVLSVIAALQRNILLDALFVTLMTNHSAGLLNHVNQGGTCGAPFF